MPRRSSALRNVWRYEHHWFQGWAVALRRRGRKRVRYFRDAGDPARALRQALDYRDELERTSPPRKTNLGRRSPDNKTGVAGVRLAVQRSAKTGITLRRYVAHWPDGEGGSVKRSFSCHKYGEAEALAQAVEARQAGLAKLRARRAGSNGPPPQVARRRRSAR